MAGYHYLSPCTGHHSTILALQITDEKRTETIMFVALQIAASLSILSKPFLPFSSDKLQRMLNLKNLSWENTFNLNLKGGDKIEKATLLFSKIEDEKIQIQIDKLKS